MLKLERPICKCWTRCD